MRQSEDDELIQLFRSPATKDKAFVRIVDTYKEKLYWHIRRMVIVHEDTDDLLQNTFIKAWKGLTGFKGESKLYTWLYRIATNECLSFLQQQKRHRTISLDNGITDFSDKISTQDNFDANKIEWKLQLAIQQLPDKQKLVFSLRYFDEMPFYEMSQVLQTSEGALKASYHHAAKKIEAFLLNH